MNSDENGRAPVLAGRGQDARGHVIARCPLVTIVNRVGRDGRRRGDSPAFITSRMVGEATKKVNIAQRWGPELPDTGDAERAARPITPRRRPAPATPDPERYVADETCC